MPQQYLDQFAGGVAGAAEDRDLSHGNHSHFTLPVSSISLYTYPHESTNARSRRFDPAGSEYLTCGLGEMMFLTIHEAAEAIKGRRVSPIDLVEQCFAAIDRWEKHVHAWVFVDREYALSEAKRLTDELAKGQYRGPLHGIPIGVKDIYDVFDWPTACGSKLWANSIARQDAPIVASLRTAGVIFLGKTVTTQWASFDPPVTHNPWNLAHTPGGSSSGSAAAVSTGMCLGALGSQTGGSITRPASYCGIAGCKPTYDLLPLEGIMPLAHYMDHPGTMARRTLRI